MAYIKIVFWISLLVTLSMELGGAGHSVYTRVNSRSILGKEMPSSKTGKLAWNCCLKTNKSFKTILFWCLFLHLTEQKVFLYLKYLKTVKTVFIEKTQTLYYQLACFLEFLGDICQESDHIAACSNLVLGMLLITNRAELSSWCGF